MLRVYKGKLNKLKDFSAQIVTDTTNTEENYVQIGGTKTPVNAQLDTETPQGSVITISVSDWENKMLRFCFSRVITFAPLYGTTEGEQFQTTEYNGMSVLDLSEDSPIIQSFGGETPTFVIKNSGTGSRANILRRIMFFDSNARKVKTVDDDSELYASGIGKKVFVGDFDLSGGRALAFKASQGTFKMKTYTYNFVLQEEKTPVIQNGIAYFEIGPNETYAEIICDQAEDYTVQLMMINTYNGSVAFDIEYYEDFLSAELVEEKKVLSDDLPVDQFSTEIYCDEGETVDLLTGDAITISSNGTVYGVYYVESIERTYAGTYSIVAHNIIGEIDKRPYYGCGRKYWRLFGDESPNFGVYSIYNELTQDGTQIDVSQISGAKAGMTGFYGSGTMRYLLCALAYCHNKVIVIDRATEEIKLVSLARYVSENQPHIIANYEDAENPQNDIAKIIGESTFEKHNFAAGEWSYNIPYAKEGSVLYSEDMDITADKIYKFYYPNEIKNPRVDFIVTDTSGRYPIEILKETPVALIFHTDPNETRLGDKVRLFSQEHDLKKQVLSTGDDLWNESAEKIEFNKFGCVGVTDFSITVPRFVDIVDKTEYLQRYIHNGGGVVKAKIILDKANPEYVGQLVSIETAHDGFKTGYITKMRTEFGYDDIADIEVATYHID